MKNNQLKMNLGKAEVILLNLEMQHGEATRKVWSALVEDRYIPTIYQFIPQFGVSLDSSLMPTFYPFYHSHY